MFPNLTASHRFNTEEGVRVTVQVPAARAQKVLDAVTAVEALKWGDYDRVAFTTAAGTQQFRSLGGGHNPPTPDTVRVACVEVGFFVPKGDARLQHVLEAIYASHPYEEPVILIEPCLRTRHIRGLDEDNPNRFWNAGALDRLAPNR